MKKIKWLVLPILLAATTLVYAVNQQPVVMLKKTSDQMLAALKTTGGSEASVKKIVRRILLPKVDVNAMSRSVVGRHYWKQANSSQRSEFKNQFVKLVIKTYAAPLSSYTNEKIEFYPIRGFNSADKRTQVKSRIMRPDGPPIPVSYRLVRRGDSWKVYDFSVEGVSLIQSYRSQFADTLRQKGFTGLLDQLRRYNRGE